MKSCSLTTLTKAIAVSLLTLFIAGRVLADDLPSFSEPEVNTFVKSYAQFVDDYIEAYKAAKIRRCFKDASIADKSAGVTGPRRPVGGENQTGSDRQI